MSTDRAGTANALAGLPRRALLIGIDAYRPGITALRTAAADARASGWGEEGPVDRRVWCFGWDD